MVAPAKTKTDAITAARTNGAALPLEYDPEYLSVAYPPNEEPMADPIRLQAYLLAMMWPLIERFGNLPDAIITTNVFLYYQLGNVRKTVAPDLMIAFDVDKPRLSLAKSYHLWMVGKPPGFVMEIGSDSTANRDLTAKREIYAKVGAREYWLFDPPDGARYKFILKGLRLADGEYAEIPMTEGAGSNIRGYSEVLGLDICWEDGAIRFYDPIAGEYLKNQAETIASLDAAEEARARAEAEVRRLRAILDDRN